MSYDSASLTTPDIKWLGVRPSDLDRCDMMLAPTQVVGFMFIRTMSPVGVVVLLD